MQMKNSQMDYCWKDGDLATRVLKYFQQDLSKRAKNRHSWPLPVPITKSHR
jgi:hypothetical protein